MAEDETVEEEKELDADKTDTTAKGSIKKWIIIGVAVLVVAAGGYAAWKFFLTERSLSRPGPQTEETKPAKAEAANKKFGLIYEMQPFIVNLLGREGKRYLKTTIEIEVESEDIQKELTRRTPQLRDAILLLLTSKSFEDVSRAEGKLLLKTELITRINQILPGSGIRTLYFTEFVVQ
jgi:flagellar FliL protein